MRLPDSIEDVERTAQQAERCASKNTAGVYKQGAIPPKRLKTTVFSRFFMSFDHLKGSAKVVLPALRGGGSYLENYYFIITKCILVLLITVFVRDFTNMEHTCFSVNIVIYFN